MPPARFQLTKQADDPDQSWSQEESAVPTEDIAATAQRLMAAGLKIKAQVASVDFTKVTLSTQILSQKIVVMHLRDILQIIYPDMKFGLIRSSYDTEIHAYTVTKARLLWFFTHNNKSVREKFTYEVGWKDNGQTRAITITAKVSYEDMAIAQQILAGAEAAIVDFFANHHQKDYQVQTNTRQA